MGLVNPVRTEHEVFSQKKELYVKCMNSARTEGV